MSTQTETLSIVQHFMRKAKWAHLSYDIETVLQVARLDPEYLVTLLLSGVRGILASPLEAHAATATTEGRAEDSKRMFELAKRLRGHWPPQRPNAVVRVRQTLAHFLELEIATRGGVDLKCGFDTYDLVSKAIDADVVVALLAAASDPLP